MRGETTVVVARALPMLPKNPPFKLLLQEATDPDPFKLLASLTAAVCLFAGAKNPAGRLVVGELHIDVQGDPGKE